MTLLRVIEKINSNTEVVNQRLKQKIENNQENVQNELTTISEKLRQIDNRQEQVIAFRATGASGFGSDEQKISQYIGNKS